ncbi:MAG: hypothetical protein ACRDPD_20110, partial [Streptosporangiaceae bacterium]
DAAPATDAGHGGPLPARTTGPGAADRSPATARPGRTVRSWPLRVLAIPAAAEVWSGWVGIAQKTGFGLVSPLPGIWPSLHLDTAITLPVGVEAYAAYALRAWLARDQAVSTQTRRFAKWSAIFSFALGMAGQVAYHLMAQAGMARAPWAVTTVVSCLPVLVLGMGTALAHMLRAEAEAVEAPGRRTTPPAVLRSLSWSPEDKAGPGGRGAEAGRDRSAGRDRTDPAPVPQRGRGIAGLGSRPAQGQVEQARMVARRLASAGRPVSRRALRSGGITGSNAALNALARMINAEQAGTAPSATTPPAGT